MIVQSQKKDAVRKRRSTHVHGVLVPLKSTDKTAKAKISNFDEDRTFTATFHLNDLRALKRIVKALEEMHDVEENTK